MWGWGFVGALALNRRGRSEDAQFPPASSSSMDGGPSMDGTDTGTDAPGDSGPGSCGAVGFTGAFPGPRRRRLNYDRKAA